MYLYVWETLSNWLFSEESILDAPRKAYESISLAIDM